MKKNNLSDIDSLDIGIIKELESNIRQPYKNIAANLGVSRPTIIGRVQKLQENGVINTFCWVDPKALGYKFVVPFFISAAGQVGAIVDRLVACPQIPVVEMCTGRFDIAAWGLFQEKKDMADFFLNELGSLPDLGHVEKLVVLQEVKAAPGFLKDEKEEFDQRNSTKAAVELDDRDIILIRELQRDARQKIGQLAKKLAVSKFTISRRINRLVDSGVMKIRSVADPFVLGYDAVAIAGIKCCPKEVENVAKNIAAYKQVLNVVICAGRYDVLAWIVLPTLDDLRHFISLEVSCVPDVKDVEIMLRYKLFKMTPKFPTY
jgi:Lrp/AsnC family transcriptional regulator, regulator for asnA, asnC and gidA